MRPVWREAFRVLRPGGVLPAGFLNPDLFVFDLDAADKGTLQARHMPTCFATRAIRPG